MRAIGIDRKARETIEQRINRLIREQLPEAPLLTERSLSVTRIMLTADELRAIKPRHQSENPKYLEGPLILAEMRGRVVIIDGANRRNKFLRTNEPGPFEALVIHVPAAGKDRAPG